MRLLAAALLACATTPALGQDDGRGDGGEEDARLPYRWFEAGIGSQHLADPGGTDERAEPALRLATNLDVAPHFYLSGSYTTARYDSQSISTLSGGIGAHAPLFRALHGTVELSLESLDGDTVTQTGYGAEAGVRWFAPALELGLSVERSRLKAAQGGPYSGASDHFLGLNLVVVVPIGEALSLTLRAERLTGTGGDLNEDRDLDTVLVGLRLRP